MKTLVLACTLFVITIVAGYDSQAQKPYRGAEYRTIGTMTYGRFEVRMRSAGVSGMLSSFFTYYDPASPWNEIDIENMGRYTNEVQYNTIVPTQADNHVQRQPVLFNPHAGFHTYAIEWTPAYVAWHIDGDEVYRQTGTHIGLLTKPQKLMMNIWQPASVDWAGSFSATQLPAYAYYDWVKYYRYTPGSNDDFTLEWSDDFTTFDTGRWQKATHTWDGNNAQFVTENAVLKDGYLILCLTSNTTSGFTGTVPTADTQAPFPVGAWGYDSTIVVRFSEAVDPASAQTASNYFGGTGITYKSASLRADGRTVDVAVSGMDLTAPFILFTQNVKDLATPANAMGLKFFRVIMPLTFPVRIDVGGAGVGGYLPDSSWTTTKQYGAVGGSALAIPAGTAIGNAAEPAMTRSTLRGIAGYKVRVPNGRYKVTMYFVEDRYTAIGKRVFRGYIEGQAAFTDLDIFKSAGAMNQEVAVATAGIVVSDNMLDVTLTASVDSTTLSGLLIEREGGAVGVLEDPQMHDELSFSIYPNPTNASAVFAVTQSVAGPASLSVYDQLGRTVSSIDLGNLEPGRHAFVWAAQGLASGVYYCRYAGPAGVLVRRALIMK